MASENVSWNARHFEDGSQHEDPELSPNLSNVGGIVAQIKWLAVGSLGERKMKAVLNELKAKLEEHETDEEKSTVEPLYQSQGRSS